MCLLSSKIPSMVVSTTRISQRVARYAGNSWQNGPMPHGQCTIPNKIFMAYGAWQFASQSREQNVGDILSTDWLRSVKLVVLQSLHDTACVRWQILRKQQREMPHLLRKRVDAGGGAHIVVCVRHRSVASVGHIITVEHHGSGDDSDDTFASLLNKRIPQTGPERKSCKA